MAHFDKKRAQVGAPGQNQQYSDQNYYTPATSAVRDEELEAILGDVPAAGPVFCEPRTTKSFLLDIELAREDFWLAYRACVINTTADTLAGLQVERHHYNDALQRFTKACENRAVPGLGKGGWPDSTTLISYMADQRHAAYTAFAMVATRLGYLVSVANFLTTDEEGATLALNATAQLGEDLKAGRGVIAEAMRSETLAQIQSEGQQ